MNVGPGLSRRSVLRAVGAAGLVGSCAGGLAQARAAQAASAASAAPRVRLASLASLSLRQLRGRDFAARFEPAQAQGRTPSEPVLAYRSDGLRVYARIVLPPASLPRPQAGWPVLLWAHGWVGAEGAPTWPFDSDPGSMGGTVIRRFADAGHVVVVPGFRGHGTVEGQRAEGLEWVQAFDNGSYLSPILYAIDLLHALHALPSLNAAVPGAAIDAGRLSVGGYSQGGDVALTALAVASAPGRPLRLQAGSIWAGCFAGRLEQARFYGGMEASADALRDPAFFGHMPSWWKPGMYRGSITDGIARKHRQLLDTVQRHVAEPGEISLQALAPQLALVDAWSQPALIQARLQLHFSDQDHYSPPMWNERLARAVAASGGEVEAHLYRGNTHGFGVERGWSPAGAVAGRGLSIERSLAFVSRTA